MKFKNSIFYKFFKNMYFLTKYDFRKNTLEYINTEQNIKNIETRLFIAEIIDYYSIHTELLPNYTAELNYILENKTDFIFPYKRLKRLEYVQSGYNTHLKLPYVLHHGKPLYFPSTWTSKQAESSYRNFIENENILGWDIYREKSPHQYQTARFHIKEDDVFFDIGAAEGLLALDTIDKVKKVFLIESDIKWIEALKATFEPYNGKITIINKLISNVDSDSSITLSSLLKMELSSPLFIKMDIEGYETVIIEASKDILSCVKNIRIACCTYHKKNDADILFNAFNSMHYKTEFSDGYMLFIYDDLKPPYFRKGVIRVEK
jgi:hypothetical protein